MNRAALLRPIDWNARWFVDYLHRLRRFELSEIVKSIPRGTRIVEIGGGTGYQAHLLSQRGYPVVSVDLPSSCHAPGMFANVMQYDGRRLPFADKSFDVALSSMVMPCVADPRALHRELARILRPGGSCVHVVPTHFWAIWRLVFYHVFLLKSAVERLARREGAPEFYPAPPVAPPARRATAEILRRCLVPRSVGVRGNAFTEPWFLRPAWWRAHFVRNGWTVIQERPIPFYHTGYRLLGSLLPVSARRRLAHLLGPSGHLFKVVPRANAAEASGGEQHDGSMPARPGLPASPSRSGGLACGGAGRGRVRLSERDVTAGPARYAVLDRMLHRAAFSVLELQKSVADVESRLCGRRIRDAAVGRPVFVAGLPRAGTTLLLNALFAVGVFAAHTYRDMPFLLTPLLWNSFSRRFRRSSTSVARAHGDGMTVGFDSPEAFEEVLWCAFWPEKYAGDKVGLWTAADARRHGEFRRFFLAHVAKVVALRRASDSFREGPPRRYLSKNNANIARFPAIRELFPDAVFLVPFRAPADQVGSLLRQHLRFCRIHAAQPFARRYMRDLGHFEFGANLRPIRFPYGDVTGCDAREHAGTARYWLEYWCAAYAHVLSSAPADAVLISYDRLCAEPDAELERIAARVSLGEAESRVLSATGRRIRAPFCRADACSEVGPQLLATAAELHDQLLERASP